MGKNSPTSFGAVIDDFVRILSERAERERDAAPAAVNEKTDAGADDLFSSLTREGRPLTPSGALILRELCKIHFEGLPPVSRARLVELFSLSETTVFKVLRDVRLLVSGTGFALDMSVNEGYGLRKIQ